MDRRHYPTQVTRLGDSDDEAYLDRLSSAERLGLVWTLTLQAWAFYEGHADEPRLRRDVGRVVRGRS